LFEDVPRFDMAARQPHRVQIIMGNVRYVAVEKDNKVTITRDGDPAGSARWNGEQMVDSSAVIPDAAFHELERLIKEGMDSNWGE